MIGEGATYSINGTDITSVKVTWKIDDEYAKKSATDALTKGLSMIGFNSDIFLGKYDDNKYVEFHENAPFQ